MENVPLSHCVDSLLILLSKALNFLLDIDLDLLEHVGALRLGTFTIVVKTQSRIFPNGEAFQVWKPFHFVDKFIRQAVDLVIIRLKSHVNFKIVLPDATIDTSVVRLLDIQLSELLFVGSLLSFRHFVHCLGLCSITWLVLDFSRGTWAICLISTSELVIGKKTFEPVVTVVLLLL